MIPFDEALALVLAAFQPLPAEIVGLQAALGRVLAEDLTARVNHPSADVSAMDGYAVRAADVTAAGARLRLIGRTTAGHAFADELAPGEAVRILTGARLPPGADAIIIQEDVEERDATVTISRSPAIGRWIRRRGQDFAIGQNLLRAGRRLTSRDLGLAAAMDIPWLPVRRRPRVGVLSTGDELVRPGERRNDAQLVESGGMACAELLRAWGAEPIPLGIAGDDRAALARMICAADGCDMLITIGGVSVGDLDLVRSALEADGFDAVFHRVAMRPGKPLLFGRRGVMPVFGLPGNPVSAWVTALLFVCPAVGCMLGLDPPGMVPELAISASALPANDDRRDHLRATLRRTVAGELEATALAGQDSAMVRTLAIADGLIIRPPLAPPVHPGEHVRVLRLDTAIARV